MNCYIKKVMLWILSLLLLTICIPVLSLESFEKMAQDIANKFNAPSVSIDYLKNKISSKAIVLLDARELDEFNTSHISKARFVGYKKFNIKSVLKDISKTDKIIVYCSVGYRSGKIADKILALGYDVSNLNGGIFSWFNRGNIILDQNGKKTSMIHGYNSSWSKWIKRGVIVY